MMTVRQKHLAQRYRPLAYKLAGKAWQAAGRRDRAELRDLEQEAQIILLKCSARYDHRHGSGASFMTFAANSIRRRLRYVLRRAVLVPVPYPAGAPVRCRQLPHDFDLAAPAEADPLELAEARAALGGLFPRERLVLTRHLGLDGRPPQTLDEIARGLGVTRERVRQIRQKALARLRRHLGAAA
jgi:RNA polymerase sigma factor (sigma-70 family)